MSQEQHGVFIAAMTTVVARPLSPRDQWPDGGTEGKGGFGGAVGSDDPGAVGAVLGATGGEEGAGPDGAAGGDVG